MHSQLEFNLDRPFTLQDIQRLRSQNEAFCRRARVRQWVSGAMLVIGFFAVLICALWFPTSLLIGLPSIAVALGAIFAYLVHWTRALQGVASGRLLDTAPVRALSAIVPDVSGNPACEAYLRKVGAQGRGLLWIEVQGLQRELQLRRASADEGVVRQALCKYGIALP